MIALTAGLAAFALSAVITGVVRSLAVHAGVIDSPTDAPERKVHTKPIPLLGGLAIFLSFFAVVGFFAMQGSGVVAGHILPKYLWGMFAGCTVLMVGGLLDDRYRLSPGAQIIFPILAAVAVIVSGVGIRFITNPLGGLIHLDNINIRMFTWRDIPYHLTLWADLFSFVWILGMTYTTKFLDGLDGLVAGITTIGSLIVFLVSARPPVLQSDTALLAVILAGACAGFLVWNWHPAKIFLGEGGSLITGFLLGTLAIISGGKIATALLIMGIPILDVVWVILRRVVVEHRSPFTTADRKHLHFRLLDVGFSHQGAVLFLCGLTAVFGITTIVFHGIQKLIALIVLTLVMAALGLWLVTSLRKKLPRMDP